MDSRAWNGAELVSASPEGLVFRLTPVISGPVTIAEGEVRFSLLGSDVLTTREGTLDPVYIVNIAVPPQASPLARTLKSSTAQAWQGRLPAAAVLNEAPAEQERIFQAADNLRGAGLLGKASFTTIGGLRVMRLPIFPVQQDAVRRQVTLAGTIEVAVDFNISANGKSPSPRTVRSANRPARLNRLARLTVINPEQARGMEAVQTLDGFDWAWPEGYLYKFSVQLEGVYQLSFENLKAKGVRLPDGGLQSERLRLYGGSGLPLPEDSREEIHLGLRECPLLIDDGGDGQFEPGDNIIFYARSGGGWVSDTTIGWAYQTNPYITTNVYWLNINPSGGGWRMSEMTVEDFADTVVTAAPVRIYQETDRFIYGRDNFLGGGLMWYSFTYDGVSRSSHLVSLEGMDLSQPVLLRTRLVNTKYTSPLIDVIVNNELVRTFLPASHTNPLSGVEQFTLSNGEFHPGVNYVTFEQRRSDTRALFDWLDVRYTADFMASRSFESISSNSIVGYDLSSQRDPILFNVSNQYSVSYARGSQINILENRACIRRYFLYNYSEFRSLPDRFQEYIAPESDLPDLLSNENTCEIIMIVPDAYWGVMKPLLEHYNRSSTAARVRLSEIYNLFSSGVMDPTAIRNFLHFTVSLPWRQPPDYVVFCGDGDYNYRNIDRPPAEAFLPPFEDINTGYSTDDWFVDFNSADGDYLPEMVTGRLTADSEWEMQNIVDKIIAYDENPEFGPWRNRAVMVADDEYGEDSNRESRHISDTEEISTTLLPAAMDKVKIFLTEYQREFGREKPRAGTDLVNAINEGALLVNYMGHGNPTLWAHEHVFVQSRDLPRIETSRKLPFYVAFTCDWGYWDDQSAPCFPEILLTQPERGAIAAIASTRLTFEDQNSALAKRFFTNLFRSPEPVTLGEALKIAKREAVYSMCPTYTLMGDPTMYPARPKLTGRFVSLSPYPLTPLALSEVQGRIFDPENLFDPEFNGVMNFTIRDVDIPKQYTITYYDSQDQERKIILNYTLAGAPVYRGDFTVRNGEFTGSFIIPEDVSMGSGANGKVVGYFNNDMLDGVIIADSARFADHAAMAQDVTPPEMWVYFNHRAYRAGDPIGAEPILIVDVFDSSGINLTGKMGHGLSITIDGQKTTDLTPYFSYNTDSHQAGSLAHVIGPLTAGEHNAEIMAWDSFNNFSVKTVSVYVAATAQELMIDRVLNWPNPFKKTTALTFVINRSAEYEIKIYTLGGRRIRDFRGYASRAGLVSDVEWDGRDYAGMTVGNGVYLYKVTAWDEEGGKVEGLGKIARIR